MKTLLVRQHFSSQTYLKKSNLLTKLLHCWERFSNDAAIRPMRPCWEVSFHNEGVTYLRVDKPHFSCPCLPCFFLFPLFSPFSLSSLTSHFLFSSLLPILFLFHFDASAIRRDAWFGRPYLSSLAMALIVLSAKTYGYMLFLNWGIKREYFVKI